MYRGNQLNTTSGYYIHSCWFDDDSLSDSVLFDWAPLATDTTGHLHVSHYSELHRETLNWENVALHWVIKYIKIK